MISPSPAETFEAQGYVARDGVLGEDELRLAEEPIREWIERQMRDWNGNRPLSHDYKTEFLPAWRSAGSPQFRRAPYSNLVHPAFYGFLRSERMLDFVGALLETDEISVHGIFNVRPMLPRAPATPWHQDAQYWRAHGEPDPELARARRVLTVWMPLQDLDPELGGLEVASLANTERRLFDDARKDEGTNYLTLAPDVIAALKGELPLLRRGGCLGFSQLTVHRGTPNLSERIRWSIDVRYEATDGATISGRRFGFVAKSPSGRWPEDTFESWSARCTSALTKAS